jgi:uncharacterized protein
MKFLGMLVLLICTTPSFAEQMMLNNSYMQEEVPIKSWKTLRNHQVIKQNFDYSCGAAALATLLNGYYYQELTEEIILKDMSKEDGMANFEDMAKVVGLYGFKAGGLALNYEQLVKLTVPVVVYLRYRGDDHFSVLRGVSASHVQLADPSWGNRLLSKKQFLNMWETREAPMKGKILLILPKQQLAHSDFFVMPLQKNSVSYLVQRGQY